MDAASAPDLKDAMTAVIGGGVALAGLLLIFCGFLFGQAALLDQNAATESRAHIDGFRAAGRIGMLPFSAGLLLAALALFYWQAPSQCLGSRCDLELHCVMPGNRRLRLVGY